MFKGSNNKQYTFRRLFAYLIDMFIISLVASLLSFTTNYLKDYENYNNEITDIMTSYQEEKLTQEEYILKINDASYDFSYYTIDYTLITCAISLFYFVVIANYWNGNTVGKKIMHLRIVKAKRKQLNMNNYLIRCLLFNGVLSNTISVIMLLTLSKSHYLVISPYVSDVFSIFTMLCLIFNVYREDGRGLHDIIAGTKVIDSREPLEEDEDIIEVVKEEVYDDMPNTVQITDEENDLKNKKKIKKAKRKETSPEGVNESERI